MSKRAINTLIVLAVLAGTWFFPVPAGLTVKAWHLFAIFLAAVAAFILQPFQNGTAALVSIVFAVVTKTLTVT